MMNQVASQTEIGKICSKQSPCSTPRLSRPAHTPSVALSHGQDPCGPRGCVSAVEHRQTWFSLDVISDTADLVRYLRHKGTLWHRLV